MALCLTAVFAYSQVWTAQDSLHLKKLLDIDQYLKKHDNEVNITTIYRYLDKLAKEAPSA